MGSGSTWSKITKTRSNREFDRCVINEFEDEQDAYDFEREIVGDRWRDDPLCINECGGGNGGHEVGEETRRKLRESHIGKQTGDKNSFYGKKHSEETKQRLREATKVYFSDPENRRRQSESHKGKKPSKETRRKMSESNKGRAGPWEGKKFSEQHKSKIGQKIKQWHSVNPDKHPMKNQETVRKWRESMLDLKDQPKML